LNCEGQTIIRERRAGMSEAVDVRWLVEDLRRAIDEGKLGIELHLLEGSKGGKHFFRVATGARLTSNGQIIIVCREQPLPGDREAARDE